MLETKKIFIQWMAVALLSLSSHAMANTLKSIDYRSLPGNGVELTFEHAEQVTKPNSFITTSPDSIVIDLPDTQNGTAESKTDVGLGFVDSVTAVQGKSRTRAIIKLLSARPYQVSTNANNVLVTISGESIQAAPVVSAAVAEPTSITNIDFRRTDTGAGRLEISLSSDEYAASIRKRNGGLTVNMAGVQIPEGWLKEFEVTDFATPVSLITSSETKNGSQFVISGTAFEPVTYQQEKQYIIEFKPVVAEEEKQAKGEIKFEGEKLTLNFQDIELRAVLQMLADFTNSNLVVSDSVNGGITLRLKDVPWDQALDIILRTKGLSMRRQDSVMFIAPSEEIAAREQQELEAELKKQTLEPIESELISVSYAKAATLSGLLKNKENKLMSERGNVTVDERTNTLLVQDTRKKIDEIRSLVEKLDIPVRQVLIESRIVIATNDFARDLGVRLGASAPIRAGDQIINFSGNSTSNTLSGEPGTVANDDLLVNLGAANLSGGVANVVLGQLGSHLLRLELSAMQQEGRGEVVSSPRLLTSNQTKASIEQGLEVPYQSSAENGGTTVSFKEAKLKLEVTPQITPDDRVMMDLIISKDSLGAAVTGVSERPIDSRELKTTVLVKNGETVVLGGVFEKEESRSQGRIPFFGDLPYVGFMFKNEYIVDETNELLIFITPKILSDTVAFR